MFLLHYSINFCAISNKGNLFNGIRARSPHFYDNGYLGCSLFFYRTVPLLLLELKIVFYKLNFQKISFLNLLGDLKFSCVKFHFF